MAWPYVVRRAAEHCPEVSLENLHRRIGYASYVNLKRRYLYYQVSKAGCTTMKWLLHDIEGLPPINYLIGTQREARRDMFIHERSNISIPSLLDLDDATQEHVLNSPDFMRFTIVRNPYARLESAWRDKVELCAPTYERYTHAIKGRLPAGNDSSSLVSFKEFVATLAHDDLANCDPHWRLQTVQTLRGALNFTHVGRLEDFSGIVRTFLAHCGNSALKSKAPMNRMPGSSHYDQAIVDRVYELYRRDFTAFDYAEDSYPRASAPAPQMVPESSFIDEVLERNLMINLLYDERDRLAERVRDLEKTTRQEVSSGHAPAIPAEAQQGMGFDELFERYISRIDGWLTKEEAAYLYGLAKQAAEGCIVEVGSYRGRSTAALAFGTNAGARLPVYAVEPHEKFRGVFGGEFGPNDRGCFMRTMAETGLYEHVRLVNVSSEFLGDNWPMPVTLLYIDGDHRYEAVKRDFECWRDKLAARAVIVLDDASNASSGPGKLAREIADGGAFRFEVGVGKMLCLCKQFAIDKLAETNAPRSTTLRPTSVPEVRPRVFGMVATRNTKFLTEKALASFFKTTTLRAVDQFLLFENEPNAAIFAKSFSIEIIRNHEPRGFAQNVNYAIDVALAANSDLIFLNKDVIFTHGWLQPLLEINDAISIPLCNQQLQYKVDGLNLSFAMDWEQFGGHFELLEEIAKQNSAKHTDEERGWELLMPFYCFRVPLKILTDVGRFDETFGTAGGEDVDYRFRTWLAGYDVVYAKRSFLLHFMGKSTWRTGEATAETKARDSHYRAAFQRKWGPRAASLFLAGGASSSTARESQISELISSREYRKLFNVCLSLDKPEIITQLRVGDNALSGASKRA